MKKFLKWFVISVLVLAAIGYGYYRYSLYQTKKLSPEVEVEYEKNGFKAEVFYNSPSMRGREIFGDLVPYGEVWRTGANEPTTLKINKSVMINGQELPEGKYTIWTIPGRSTWDVIFNDKMYRWGITYDGTASREPQYDALTVTVPIDKISRSIERFTIELEEGKTSPLEMRLIWDHTLIVIPMVY